MYLFVQGLLLCHMCFQLFHISGNQRRPLFFIGNSVQIQHRRFHTAADTHRIPVCFIAACILYIESAAALTGQTLDGRQSDFIAAYPQIRHHAGKGSRLRMVLCGNQLQCRPGTRAQLIMPHIDYDLFPFIGSHTQRLPCVQATETQMGIICGSNRRIDVYYIIETGIQKPSGIFQLLLQGSPFRMVLSAFGILCIQTCLQGIYGFFCHITSQRRVQIICIQRKNIIFQTVIVIKIHLCHYDIPQIAVAGKTKTDPVGGNRLCQFDGIVSSSAGIFSLYHTDLLCIDPIRMFFVIIENRSAAKAANVLCFCKRDVVHFVVVIQCK